MSSATSTRAVPPDEGQQETAEEERSAPSAGAGDGDGDRAVEAASGNALFGRGMLYVVVAGMQLVTGALAAPVLAHVLDDPAQLGSLATAIALHQLLSALLLVGMNHAIVLRRAQDGHDHVVRALASTAMILVSVLTLVAWAGAAWWAPALGMADSPLLTLTILWTIPSAGILVCSGLLLAADRLRAFTVVGALTAIGGQVVGLAFLLLQEGRTGTASVTSFATGLVAMDVLGCVLGFVLVRPRVRGALSWRTAGPALAVGGALVIDSVSVFALTAGDRIVLQRLAGAEEVGRYQIAYTLGYVAVQVIGLMSWSWTPRFAAISDSAVRRRLIGEARDTVLRLLSPVVLGMVLGAPLGLRIVAPESFRPSTLLPVVLLVLLSAYPVAASSASGRMLITEGRNRTLAACTVVAAAVNIGFNLLAIPRFGIEGAAAATLVAFGVQAVLQRVVVGGWSTFPRTPRRVLVEAAVVILLASASLLVPQGDVGDAVRFALAVACLPWCVVRFRRAQR
ncbi:lipopolysaccharide biosynthesis protein [Kineococcus rubinsiae]|uniref:lipopolysaccharide biosynthesis protein n=1 Tax=Kineococcus rubinsiae TaxID=2609562 RepID=UPI00142F8B1E|nr:polysaccharide biosynthesis C-terminal domain-containing protein [Kineococcus rubinsiae]NIZ92041.1 oligosaccharide flippase family protein [Kineococcus rubinsiae]